LNDKPRGRSYVRKQRARDARTDGIFRRPADVIRTLLSPLVRLSGGGVAPEGKPAFERGEDRARIVVPRQERGEEPRTAVVPDLREVRTGSRPGDRYLRYVPSKRPFVLRERGYIEATREGSRPRGLRERLLAAIKGIALGNPFATSQLVHERLSKLKALAIFSSDALSSSAYATEEILLMLVLAGAGALTYSMPIALVIVVLLGIVTVSYRQTIKAYPSGGGAYIVAHENLGRRAGLLAGAALLVDYVLTVSVSVAAGVAAVTSAIPDLHELRVPIGIAIIALMTVGNLRGIREAGTLFAIPTYFFIFSMGTVIVVGLIKVMLGDTPDPADQEKSHIDPAHVTQGITLFLVLRAFSQGCTALTGVEAISNGVPAFKTPSVENARTTMVMMACFLACLFLGITFITSRFGFVPDEALPEALHTEQTIVSKVGREVLGENVLYYGYQVATALVLFLAANTSYNGFPPLGAILARDRFLPRQFSFRGDRLAYSNGIIILAVSACVLLAIFGGEVSRLIPLYALGVFVSFTLSQSGMVRHFFRLRDDNWKISLAISAVGATATGVVAVIIGLTKFVDGAWLSVLMMVVLMALLATIRRHYDWFARKIAVEESALPAGVPGATSVEAPREHVIVPVDGINKIALGAIGMAREISPMVTAVHLTDDREQAEAFREQWEHAVPDVPLLIIESPYRQFVAPMLTYLERLDEMEEQRVTVILPTFVARHWWERILHNRDVLRLRPFLKERRGVRVVDFPYRLYEDEEYDKARTI
jgi:amino acid transporter